MPSSRAARRISVVVSKPRLASVHCSPFLPTLPTYPFSLPGVGAHLTRHPRRLTSNATLRSVVCAPSSRHKEDAVSVDHLSENLQGKVAIVTGAASGIGLAVTRKLNEYGVSVVAEDIDPAVQDQFAGCDMAAPLIGDVAQEQ